MNNNDENEIFVLRSDERVLQHIDIPKAETIDDARKFIEKINSFISNNESILWAICLKNDNTLIGTICFWNINKENLVAEIGYILHPDFQGKGIMQEAANEIIDYGFTKMKLKAIVADLNVNNAKSIKLLEKTGFTFTKKSDEKDIVIYTLPYQTFGNL
jgi:ribosomal-protein-alanine N-acetyltransferase